MLIVTKSQLDAISAEFRERFIRTVVGHVRQHFPDRVAALGDAGLRATIETGIARAERLGLVAEQDVAGVIHFSFESAIDFDIRPEYAWAMTALARTDLEPTERVDLLFAEWQPRKPTGGPR